MSSRYQDVPQQGYNDNAYGGSYGTPGGSYGNGGGGGYGNGGGGNAGYGGYSDEPSYAKDSCESPRCLGDQPMEKSSC